MLNKLKVVLFLLAPSVLHCLSYEAEFLSKIGSDLPFYVVYVLVTLKASEFSASRVSAKLLVLFSIGHLVAFLIWGITGLIGFLMYFVFHEINKRSFGQSGKFAKLSYGSSYVAKRAVREDNERLTDLDLAITIAAIIAAFAFYFSRQ